VPHTTHHTPLHTIAHSFRPGAFRRSVPFLQEVEEEDEDEDEDEEDEEDEEGELADAGSRSRQLGASVRPVLSLCGGRMPISQTTEMQPFCRMEEARPTIDPPRPIRPWACTLRADGVTVPAMGRFGLVQAMRLTRQR
jgi:hypothetical protein